MLAKILAQEEGERLAVEVVQEIVKKAGNIVYEHYIQRKVVPYAVQQTKEKILELIKLYFFEYDQGEGDISNKPEWNIDPGRLISSIQTIFNIIFSFLTLCQNRASKGADRHVGSSRHSSYSEGLDQVDPSCDGGDVGTIASRTGNTIATTSN